MKFYIKQKVFTFKDKFDISDEHQNPCYQVKGKLMSISNKLELQDLSGATILRSHKKVLTLLPKYFIYNNNNEEIATIQAKLSFLKPKFILHAFNKEMVVEGDFFSHSFSVSDNVKTVATIQKKLIAWGDTYEIEILDENHIEEYLFIVIILDQIIHERKNR